MFKNLLVNLMKLLKKIIKNAKKIVAVAHYNPDGDALGASLALYLYLKNKGINSHVIVPSEGPHFLTWLPHYEKVVNFEKQQNEAVKIIKEADVIFHLDYNSIDRTKAAAEYIKHSNATMVLIDHHPNPDNTFDLVFSNTERSSTCELLYEVLEVLGKEFIDNEIATCLFTGIMTDTLCFRVNSSNPLTFRIISKLLTYKINIEEIYNKIYDNFSPDRMRLLGHCLSHNLMIMKEYKTAYLKISRNEKATYNLQKGDSEGFVNYPLSIKGIVFSVIFIEDTGHVNISFRSKGNFDVGMFARKHFDGGGHKNAAGGESKQSLSEAINFFINLLPQYKESLNRNNK